MPDLGPHKRVHPARGRERQGERVLCDGCVVQRAAARHRGARGESSRQPDITPGREQLHPRELAQARGRVEHERVVHAPHDQGRGINMRLRDWDVWVVDDDFNTVDGCRERHDIRDQKLHAARSFRHRAPTPGWAASRRGGRYS